MGCSKTIGEGKPVSVVPIATELITQKAAEILGCSIPHFVKILEEVKNAYKKVGKHCLIRFEV